MLSGHSGSNTARSPVTGDVRASRSLGISGLEDILKIDVSAPTSDRSSWRLEGALTTDTADVLRAVAPPSARVRHLHLDLGAVTEVDHPGLGSLLGVIRAARERYLTVSVTARDRTRNLLVSSGIDRLVHLAGGFDRGQLVPIGPIPAERPRHRRAPYPDPLEPGA
jgi:ABC-type transporter Mla MlaB component